MRHANASREWGGQGRHTGAIAAGREHAGVVRARGGCRRGLEPGMIAVWTGRASAPEAGRVRALDAGRGRGCWMRGARAPLAGAGVKAGQGLRMQGAHGRRRRALGR